MAEDGDDGDEGPVELVAVTAKVYVVPIVNPLMLHVVALVVVQLLLPGDEVTV